LKALLQGGVGTFAARVELGDPTGDRFEPVDALVDTGSLYLWAPSDLLIRLGVQPIADVWFELADGKRQQRPTAETKTRLDGSVRTTTVVFGHESSRVLLGSLALETFGLAVDPVHRRLVPIDAIPAMLSLREERGAAGPDEQTAAPG
jgi:predicted aspartyl protease